MVQEQGNPSACTNCIRREIQTISRILWTFCEIIHKRLLDCSTPFSYDVTYFRVSHPFSLSQILDGIAFLVCATMLRNSEYLYMCSLKSFFVLLFYFTASPIAMFTFLLSLVDPRIKRSTPPDRRKDFKGKREQGRRRTCAENLIEIKFKKRKTDSCTHKSCIKNSVFFSHIFYPCCKLYWLPSFLIFCFLFVNCATTERLTRFLKCHVLNEIPYSPYLLQSNCEIQSFTKQSFTMRQLPICFEF